ncbi:uncharacterized protein LOC108681692 [Hyalella azteca]|uniref:Uncharacterized protein LOC108681692 n=1 Tax=Hyalella azteca TaxID=294128 RepID=A0A8B7PLG7_HYAAZ|nr:uncharacterized protein LOC108681692 [Hyalella azteca]XP_047739564.1 uncharacterized protein LOC108681692 [Hyalella azteca]XP_047739565.1 uncharacterized protein LOC108681692 [Hyalella azteca]
MKAMVAVRFFVAFQLMVGCGCSEEATGPESRPPPPTFYGSRTLPGLFPQRTSHIGPLPHLNSVLTEWSRWGEWTKCSRSCGTGVRSRTRHCIAAAPRVMPGSGIRTSHDQCVGPNTQYDACSSQPCAGGSDLMSGASFRAVQCRLYNNRKVFGKLVTRWLPYTQGATNSCALVCEGEGAGIVYTFGKVRDGTQCSADRGLVGICVNGRCLRMSCDGQLGGTALEDQCRVCGGNNTTCTLHKGIFHSPVTDPQDEPYNEAKKSQIYALDEAKNLKYHSAHGAEEPAWHGYGSFRRDQFVADQPTIADEEKQQKGTIGYYEVTLIPKGSTNIKVSDHSHNFLALREGNKFLLNGDWLIDWPGEVEAGGVMFSYSRAENDSEQLTALGPTKSNLSLMILLREENPGVYYEYWTPNSNSNGLPSIHFKKTSKPSTNWKPDRKEWPSIKFHGTNFDHQLAFEKSKTSEATSLSGFNFTNDSVELRLRSGRKTDAVLHKALRHSARNLSKRRHQNLELSRLNSLEQRRIRWTKSHANPRNKIISEDTQLSRQMFDEPIRFGFQDDNPAHFSARLNTNVPSSISKNSPRNREKHFRFTDAVPLQEDEKRLSRRRDHPIASRHSSSNRVQANNAFTNSKISAKNSPAPSKWSPNKKTHRRRKIRRTKKKRRQKNPALVCPKCSRVREVKKHFCTSDFVSRVQVVSFDAAPKEKNNTTSKGRYEVTILQSFKNTVPLLHKEFIYVENFNCACPKLQSGKIYLIMGKTYPSGNGREVQLGLDRSSYTRQFTTRVLGRVLKIRSDEMKYCKKWRKTLPKPIKRPIYDNASLDIDIANLPMFAELATNALDTDIETLPEEVQISPIRSEEGTTHALLNINSEPRLRPEINAFSLIEKSPNVLDRRKTIIGILDNSLDPNNLGGIKRKWHYNFRH